MTESVKNGGECYVGVDLGGTNVLAAVTTPQGEVLARAKKRSRGAAGADAIVGLCCEAVTAAIDAAGVDRACVKGVGVGAPGTIDAARGVVAFAPNLKDFTDVPMKQMMEDRLGIPTFLDNDVNVGVWGEYVLGAGQGASSLVGLFLGTGIGGGIVLNGELWRGFNGTAGEVGHIVITQKGAMCGCGNVGCMEANASRTGIVRMIQRAKSKGKKSLLAKLVGGDFSKVTSKVIVQAVEAGDKVTQRALKKAWRMLGIGIANIVNLLSPELIILGGGLMEALGDAPLEAIEPVVRDYAMPHTMDNVRIVASALGDDAGILGAAALARTELAKAAQAS